MSLFAVICLFWWALLEGIDRHVDMRETRAAIHYQQGWYQ